jgi:sulfite reductase beta subunit-like hemoprotein
MSAPISSRDARVAGPRASVRAEIDELAASIARYRAGQMAEPLFVERRLRHGIYGQRQDGVHMLRSKLPAGILSPDQMVAFADIAEVYGNGVAHLTTRQDIQVHFVQLPRTPELLRDLDENDMSAREACGNVVRNVTVAANAGVAPGEPFDVTPHALRLARFALIHPDGQSLARKFKVHFAGTDDPAWNLARIHDLGFTAREQGGEPGFEVRAGGGLGAVPMEAGVLYEWLPADGILGLTQAVLRVFGRYGEKKNRARARMKFLIADRGLDWFRAEVEREWEVDRASGAEPRREVHPLRPVPDTLAWTAGGSFEATNGEQARWAASNVVGEREPGRVSVRVRVPRGDLSPTQLRGFAALVAQQVGDSTRITPEQGFLIRGVAIGRLQALHEGLVGIGLGGVANGVADPITCPGADTCKLGITRPRAVARDMEAALDALAVNPRIAGLRVHISGCPNGCAQHAIADIGLYGAARTVNGVVVPHYLVLLGGAAGGTAFGSALAKVPAGRVGEAVAALARAWPEGESFSDWVRRTPRERLKALLEPLQELPALEAAPGLYREPGSDEGFRVVRGTGECAGEVVDQADFRLADADAAVENARATVDPEEANRASALAFRLGMRALLAMDHAEPRDEEALLPAFRLRYYEAGRIFEGVGFYALQALGEAEASGDRLRRRVAEAELFVQECHSILGRLRAPAVQPKGTAESA